MIDSEKFRTPIEYGVFYDLPRAKYDALPAINQTLLNAYNECEEDALAIIQGEKIKVDDGSAYSFGNDFHVYVLESARFAAEYEVVPSFGNLRLKINRESKKAYFDQLKKNGINGVLPKDFQAMDRMRKRLMEDETVDALMKLSRSEVTFVWRDSVTGLNCKGRVDGYAESVDIIADLKSCESAKLRIFQSKIFQWGYHRQAAFYRQGLMELKNHKTNYLVCAIEKKVPYKYITYEIPEIILELGFKEMRGLLDRIDVSLKTGEWKGYPKGVQPIGIPTWYLNKLGDEHYGDE